MYLSGIELSGMGLSGMGLSGMGLFRRLPLVTESFDTDIPDSHNFGVRNLLLKFRRAREFGE